MTSTIMMVKTVSCNLFFGIFLKSSCYVKINIAVTSSYNRLLIAAIIEKRLEVYTRLHARKSAKKIDRGKLSSRSV